LREYHIANITQHSRKSVIASLVSLNSL
jgi:hypothetical protein